MKLTEVGTKLAAKLRDFGRPYPYPVDLLNESARIALSNDEIGLDQVLAIVDQPHYDLLSPYFALKLLAHDKPAQHAALTTIVNSIATTGRYTGATQVIRDLSRRPDAATLRVNPKKLSRVAQIGPTGMEERMTQMVKGIQPDETPVLIAYSGLYGMRPALQRLQDDQALLIVLPEDIEAKNSQVGYKLTKRAHSLSVDFLTPADLDTQASLVFIDDLMNTGKTWERAQSIFPHAARRAAFQPVPVAA